MTLSRIKGNQIKPQKPQYWRIVQLLRKLRLKYSERDKGEASFHITIDLFGVVLKFNPRQNLAPYNGWDEVYVDLEQYELNPIEFGQNLMWLLISKGYMAFLRGPEDGNGMIWRRILVQEGWGLKIIEKRLTLYNNEPKHRFMIEYNKKMRDLPMSYLLSYHPDFFDYLW